MNERGSALVESVFGITLLALGAVAIMQVAFVMFARNVVAAAAHEGVRVAIERGSDPADARAVALDVMAGVAGGLVGDVGVTTTTTSDRLIVRITGSIDTFGPLPLAIPVNEQASAALNEDP